MSNYIDDLLKLHYKQTDKGYGKYGKPLEQHDAEILERLQHLQEELMDALHYTFWLGEKLREEIINCSTCFYGSHNVRGKCGYKSPKEANKCRENNHADWIPKKGDK